jgi:hypothetical protein
LALLAVAGGVHAQLREGRGCARFAGAYANVRSGPGLQFNVVGRLGQNECAVVLNTVRDMTPGDNIESWVQLRLDSGNTGYIAAPLFEVERFAATYTPSPTATPDPTPTAEAVLTGEVTRWRIIINIEVVEVVP